MVSAALHARGKIYKFSVFLFLTTRGTGRICEQKASERRLSKGEKQTLKAQRLFFLGFAVVFPPSLGTKLIFKCENCLSRQKWKRKEKTFQSVADTLHNSERVEEVCGGGGERRRKGLEALRLKFVL